MYLVFCLLVFHNSWRLSKSKFVVSWFLSPGYVPRIGKATSEYSAKFKWCLKKFDLSNMGKSTLKIHMKKEKHVEKAPVNHLFSVKNHFNL